MRMWGQMERYSGDLTPPKTYIEWVRPGSGHETSALGSCLEVTEPLCESPCIYDFQSLIRTKDLRDGCYDIVDLQLVCNIE